MSKTTIRTEEKPKRGRPPLPIPLGNWYSSWHGLAAALGVTRIGLIQIRSRFGDACPKPRPADGRHSLKAWQQFFAENNINARKVNSQEVSEDDLLKGMSVADLQKRLLIEKIIAQQFSNQELSGELVALIELQESLSKLFLAIRQDCLAMVSDLTTDLEGIDDYHEREEIITKRMDMHLALIEGCAWLEKKIKRIEPAKLEPEPDAQEEEGSL